MKKFIIFILVNICVMAGITGCAEEKIAPAPAVSAVFDSESAPLKVQIKQNADSIPHEDDILLEEVPEHGYSYYPDYYICYNDILILEDDVYRYENGNYVKTDETLHDMLGIKDNSYFIYRQYKNLIIRCEGNKFILYDLDTKLSFDYLVQVDSENCDILDWYLYDEYLYYRIFPLNEIRRIHLLDGQEQIIYDSKKDSMGIREFAMRSDGKILCEWWNSNKREYYLIELYDNGEWKEEKIWETDGDRWKYVAWYACNQYGLFQVAECTYITSRTEKYISMDENVIIRDNGTVENFDIEMNGGYNLYLDTGCLVSYIPYSKELLDEDKLHVLNHHVSGVIFYDYAGNVQRTYQLVDPAIFQKGYYMRKLLYHDEKITAIYEQENTGELYIVQVEAKGL